MKLPKPVIPYSCTKISDALSLDEIQTVKDKAHITPAGGGVGNRDQEPDPSVSGLSRSE